MEERKRSSSAGSSGLGLFSVLGVIFVTLKLLDVGAVAAWSWLWVLSPFWIGAALLAVALLAVAFWVLAVAFWVWMADRKR